MQPHCEQSGVPPNWQGVIFVFRSAEYVSVVWAKMQSLGDAGGFRNSSIMRVMHIDQGIALPQIHQLFNDPFPLVPASESLVQLAPCCGVNKLNQMRFVSLCALQNRVKSSRYPGRSIICPVTVQ